MDSILDFFGGANSVLSVCAVIVAFVAFCLRTRVRFETELSPWRDPNLVGIFVSGRSSSRNADLTFRAVAVGGKLRLIPDSNEDICRAVIHPVEPRKSVLLEVQTSGSGDVWSEDLLFKLDPGFRGGFVLLIPAGRTIFCSLLSWKLITIPPRSAAR